MKCWTHSGPPAACCSVVQTKNVKHTVTGITLRFQVLPWELMLPGMFVLKYKSRCQFQRACQRSKTSTHPDGDDRKHTDIAWVNGEGSSLERWLEKCVFVYQKCVCVFVLLKLCPHWVVYCMCAWLVVLRVYLTMWVHTSHRHTSQGCISICKYELSLINNLEQREA